MKKLPWRSAFYLVALTYLFLDLRCCNGPLKRKIAEIRPSSAITLEKAKKLGWVALVNQEPITSQQLNLSVSRHLYQRGKDYKSVTEKNLSRIRRASLRGLIDDILIRQYTEGVDFEAPAEEMEKFIEDWENQFQNKKELEERSNYQGLTKDERHKQLGKIWSQKRWLEKRIAPGIGISDEEIVAWYEINKTNGKLIEPEKISARHIFISTVEEDGEDQQALIKKAQTRVADGEDFGEVARELSQDDRTKDRGGDLNWFSRSRVPADFAGFVFDQKSGTSPEPFKTKIGWHLVEVIDRQPEREIKLEDIKEEIRIHLLNQQQVDKVNELLGKLRKVAHIIVFRKTWSNRVRCQNWRFNRVQSMIQ